MQPHKHLHNNGLLFENYVEDFPEYLKGLKILEKIDRLFFKDDLTKEDLELCIPNTKFAFGMPKIHSH